MQIKISKLNEVLLPKYGQQEAHLIVYKQYTCTVEFSLLPRIELRESLN